MKIGEPPGGFFTFSLFRYSELERLDIVRMHTRNQVVLSIGHGKCIQPGAQIPRFRKVSL